MNEYRDFIDTKSSEIINKLNGTITPVPANTLYRDFLDIRFDDVINAIDNVKVKSFTYTGTDSYTNRIEFPEPPKMFCIFGDKTTDTYSNILIWTEFRLTHTVSLNIIKTPGQNNYIRTVALTYPDDKTVILDGSTPSRSMNNYGTPYIVYYI